MLHRIMTARLQNVVKAYHITLYVSVRVADRVPHPCLCGKVDHRIRVILLKNAVEQLLIRKISFDERVVIKLPKRSEAGLLDPDVVIFIHIVQTDNLHIRLRCQQPLRQIRPYETRCTCNKNCHTFVSLNVLACGLALVVTIVTLVGGFGNGNVTESGFCKRGVSINPSRWTASTRLRLLFPI